MLKDIYRKEAIEYKKTTGKERHYYWLAFQRG